MPSQLSCHGDSQAGPTRPPARASIPRKPLRRRGFSVVWLILWIPVLLVLSCLIVDVANVWLARVELENGLEAAALAAVKEWAETGDNLLGRRVGVAYACHNTVRGRPIVIGTNYDAAGGVNENDECCITAGSPSTGNLIFGAAIEDPTTHAITFNAGEAPGCGAGTVLFDATGEGQGNLAAENAWGIAFRAGDPNNANLRIVKIEIDLQANGGGGVFVPGGFLISTQDSGIPVCSQVAVADNSGNCQLDLEGLAAGDIANSFISGNTVLVFEFPDVAGTGFEPGDRFRFGVGVSGVGSGNGQDDGDGIGMDAVQVRVYFNTAPLIPVVGQFFNNTERKNDCFDPALVDGATGSLIVHPTGIPDLPCPATSAANNNGQSYGLLQGTPGREFAVRAQARVEVPTLWRSLFGNCIGSHRVTVKTTAVYNCASRRPKLLILDDYVCPGP